MSVLEIILYSTLGGFTLIWCIYCVRHYIILPRTKKGKAKKEKKEQQENDNEY